MRVIAGCAASMVLVLTDFLAVQDYSLQQCILTAAW